MAQFQAHSTGEDRVMAALVSGLEREFGRDAGAALAHRFLEAERIEFHWEARVEERWVGSYASVDEEDSELDSVRILGSIDGRWFVAVMIVDGDGNPHAMTGRRQFGHRKAAVRAFADA